MVESIADGCRQANCGLIGGETAEMPSMYRAGEYDLAGFSVGAVSRGSVLPRPLSAGDVVLGLRSSGVHSNGFSLVRRIVELKALSYSDRAPFSSSGKTLAGELLTPTKIYVRALLPIIKKGIVKALAHITGGGLPENIPRVLGPGLAARLVPGGSRGAGEGSADGDASSAWELPGVFRWLRDEGGLEQAEMLRTLNCGVGMAVVVSATSAAEAKKCLQEAGEGVIDLGLIEERAGPDAPQVIIDGEL